MNRFDELTVFENIQKGPKINYKFAISHYKPDTVVSLIGYSNKIQ